MSRPPGWEDPTGLPQGIGRVLQTLPIRKTGRTHPTGMISCAKMHPVVSKVMDCSGGSRTGVRWGGVKDLQSSKLNTSDSVWAF